MKKNLSELEKMYSRNLGNYGIDSRSVGWKSKHSQELRFAILNNLLRDTDQLISINDYGCGYGAHLSNLILSGFNVSKYCGYDISLPMIEALKDLHKNSDIEINTYISDEIQSTADYTFVSGTFNVKGETNDEEWSNFVKGKLFEIAKKSLTGFAFNLLSTEVDWKSKELYYADPEEFYSFCKNDLKLQSKLYKNYGLYEWSISCYL
jgi:SAM-dependent methyltransferase